jgi:hypothetical protein
MLQWIYYLIFPGMRPKEPEQPQDISYDSGGGGDEIIQDEPESKKVK